MGPKGNIPDFQCVGTCGFCMFYRQFRRVRSALVLFRYCCLDWLFRNVYLPASGMPHLVYASKCSSLSRYPDYVHLTCSCNKQYVLLLYGGILFTSFQIFFFFSKAFSIS
ncbi:Cardosin-H [Trichinella spiralis]|uniref:Cardosin-H n=1 Tax=Trichinella spiralis TaxID=6334 RepID=A0ABR3K2F8_TRISP